MFQNNLGTYNVAPENSVGDPSNVDVGRKGGREGEREALAWPVPLGRGLALVHSSQMPKWTVVSDYNRLHNQTQFLGLVHVEVHAQRDEL